MPFFCKYVFYINRSRFNKIYILINYQGMLIKNRRCGAVGVTTHAKILIASWFSHFWLAYKSSRISFVSHTGRRLKLATALKGYLAVSVKKMFSILPNISFLVRSRRGRILAVLWHTYARRWDGIWKKTFSGVTLHGLKYENNTYMLKRSIDGLFL